MNGNNVNRREVLKSTGVAIGVTTIGTTAKASSGSSLGNVRLIEAGIKYELQEDDSYSRWYSDSPSDYVKDLDNGSIVLSQISNSTIKETIKQNQTIVNGVSVGSPPALITSGQPTRAIPTKLTNRYKPSEVVALESPFQEPKIGVQEQEDSLILSGGGLDNHHLNSMSDRTFTLPIKQVEARAIDVQNEQVYNPEVPEYQRGLQTKFRVEQVKVKPVLNIRDYGNLDVIDATM